MKVSRVSFMLLVLLGTPGFGVLAQNPNPSQDQGQSPQNRGSGQRGNRGGGWGGGALLGRGVLGTVTEIAPDHFTVKTQNGDLYTIHYSVNTRFAKSGLTSARGRSNENEPPANPPQPGKAADIKVGDAITALGELDVNAKSVGAVAIVQLDPERARQMREMQANYGKTWLAGKVTAVNDVNVTLQGGLDNAAHAFVADENTTFRKMREPITLGDIQVGDMVRVEGAVKNGAFLASTVAVITVHRNDGEAPPSQ
jgi:Domain of unknown function (DUF5666)